MAHPGPSSTPRDQIQPPEADPNNSILRGLRERRDRPEPGFRAVVPLGQHVPDTPTQPAPNRPDGIPFPVDTHHGLQTNRQSDGNSRRTDTDGQRERNPEVPTSSANQPAAPSQGQPRSTSRYEDVAPVFAVDVSWSTHILILDHEKKAVWNLTKRLSNSKMVEARVIPWNSRVHPSISAISVDMINSSGGTNPAVLTKGTHDSSILQDCSLWFLMTDGEIDAKSIENFAAGISAKGIHGKACIIVLFGNRPKYPTNCNISVGQAVFAVAPDCAFLFYDVDTEDIYVFQCKGSFRGLLGDKQTEIVLDRTTLWESIPRITYDQLAKIAIPEPRHIGANTVILEGERQIDLEDLYNDRLNSTAVAEILDNDDNLKSVLLTAQSRGKSKEIEKWVSKQRITSESSGRPDVQGEASKLVKDLVMAMKIDNRDLKREKMLKKQLRNAHTRNWSSFLLSMKTTANITVQRNTVVDDALARVQLSRDSPSSPSMLSPVTPGRSSRRIYLPSNLSPPAVPSIGSAPQYRDQRSPRAPRSSTVTPPPRPSRSDSYSPVDRSSRQPLESGSKFPYHNVDTEMGNNEYDADSATRLLHEPTSGNVRPLPFPNTPELSKLLYTTGYELGPRSSNDRAFYGRCALCDDETSPLALLLRAKPPDCETEGEFPAPQSYQPIIYPFAMGNFPETDVISSFLCCEKCAFFVRRMGFSPEDDSITGSVPLVSLSHGVNRDRKLKEIDAALDGRFDKSILDQIFLSILYGKLDSVTAESPAETDLLIKALRWEARNFSSQIMLSTTLAESFDPNDSTPKSYLFVTMSSQLQSLDAPTFSHLLQYPVDGFVTLLEAMLDYDQLYLPDNSLKMAIFQRLLFHFVEQHCMLRQELGASAATDELRRALNGEIGGLIKSRFSAEVEALDGTYLLESDVLGSFRRLNPVFGDMERACGPAIRVFLDVMLDPLWEDGPPGKVFQYFKGIHGDDILFSAPWELDEADCETRLRLMD